MPCDAAHDGVFCRYYLNPLGRMPLGWLPQDK